MRKARSRPSELEAGRLTNRDLKNRSIRTAAIVLITTALFAASFLWPFDNIGIANAEDELTYHEDVEDAVAEMREAMK